MKLWTPFWHILFAGILLANPIICMDATEENVQQSTSKKRSHEQALEANAQDNTPTEFKPFRNKERKIQIRLTNHQSAFVEGDEAARLVWSQNLDLFSGSKKPEKQIDLPATIHDKLAYIGNHLRACAEGRSQFDNFKRNVLIPHVSFVIKRDTSDQCERLFIPGGYVSFDPNYEGDPTAFISGGDSMPWEGLNTYNIFRKRHNSHQDRPHELPVVRVYSGREVEKALGKKLPSAQQQAGCNQGCLYHTEEMLYEMLLANPQAITTIAQDVLWPIDEVIHVVFDMYSWWDVCPPCQTRFRKEYFRGEIHQKLGQTLDDAGYAIPKESGLLPIFRVSSYKQYNSDSLPDMSQAAGGIPGRDKFEATTLSQSQVVLSNRKAEGSFNYQAICKKVFA